MKGRFLRGEVYEGRGFAHDTHEERKSRYFLLRPELWSKRVLYAFIVLPLLGTQNPWSISTPHTGPPSHGLVPQRACGDIFVQSVVVETKYCT